MTGPRLRVGLVGGGTMAKVHAAAWKGSAVDLYVSDAERSADLAADYEATIVTGTEGLFGMVDIVDICTPTPSHHAIAKRALEAGAHVVCEKPLARTSEEVGELIQLARAKGRTLFPAHVVRYFPEYVAAKRAVDEGRLGELSLLKFTRTGAAPSPDWYGDDADSGGIVLDQMIHDIDQALWLAGPIEKVYGAEHRATAGGKTRIAQAILTHRSGAITQCQSVWGAPATPFSYSFEYAGTNGVVRHDSRFTCGIRVQITADSRGAQQQEYVPDAGSGANPYQLQIEDFVASILSGSAARVTANDGQRAIDVSLAIISSIATGRAISIPNWSPTT